MSTLYEDLPLTNFPSDGVDTFPTYLNVTATDGPLIQQYMEAMNAGNQVLANQILSQIPAAEQKVIKATDLNKVMQATLAVERFYKDDIYDYIAQEQQNWENIINQFTYKGIYSSGNAYQKYNMVGYTTNGSTLVYIAIQDVPTGNAPLNETFWRVMTIQGQEGEPGVGLSYRLEWNPATQYEPNQAVTYDGVLWMALQTNINVQPGTDDSIWEKVLDFTVTTYPIQPTQPTNLPVGGLWFNTEGNPTQYYYLTPLQSPASAGEIGTGYQAYDSEGNVIMGTATLDGPTYIAGNGIKITGDVISAKISTDANNKVEFGTDGGLLVDTGVNGAVQGNFVGFGANGQLIDSEYNINNFAPEMILGVEYKTINLYNGKPIYVKLINFGYLPNQASASVSHGVLNIDSFVSVSGSTSDGIFIPSMIYGGSYGESGILQIRADRTYITIYAGADRRDAAANILMYYTKTTD